MKPTRSSLGEGGGGQGHDSQFATFKNLFYKYKAHNASIDCNHLLCMHACVCCVCMHVCVVCVCMCVVCVRAHRVLNS